MVFLEEDTLRKEIRFWIKRRHEADSAVDLAKAVAKVEALNSVLEMHNLKPEQEE